MHNFSDLLFFNVLISPFHAQLPSRLITTPHKPVFLVNDHLTDSLKVRKPYMHVLFLIFLALVLKNALLLEVRNLHVEYVLDNKVTVNAVNNVDLNVHRGEILGIVGESGCGKSTLAYSILASVPPPGRIRKGEIIYHGWDSPKTYYLYL